MNAPTPSSSSSSSSSSEDQQPTPTSSPPPPPPSSPSKKIIKARTSKSNSSSSSTSISPRRRTTPKQPSLPKIPSGGVFQEESTSSSSSSQSRLLQTQSQTQPQNQEEYNNSKNAKNNAIPTPTNNGNGAKNGNKSATKISSNMNASKGQHQQKTNSTTTTIAKKNNNIQVNNRNFTRRRRKLAKIEQQPPSTSTSSFATNNTIQKSKDDNEQKDATSQKKKETESNTTKNLPPNQYECVLKRRAVVKLADKKEHMKRYDLNNKLLPSSPTTKRRTLFTKPNNNTEPNNNTTNDTTTSTPPSSSLSENEELYGDTTLGMKLTILSGKVIVQSIIPLNDGRASPAQLSGYIQRGDVILSINEKSLARIGPDKVHQLVDLLAPLSNPKSIDGLLYDREVKIRFEMGSGLKLLNKNSNDVVTGGGGGRGRSGAGSANTTSHDSSGHQDSSLDQKGISTRTGDSSVMATTTTTPANTPTVAMDGAGDLFNLSKFTFVDQLSGKPLFDDHINNLSKNNSKHGQQNQEKDGDNDNQDSHPLIVPSLTSDSITVASPDRIGNAVTPKRKNKESKSKNRLNTAKLRKPFPLGTTNKRLKYYHSHNQQQSLETRLTGIGYACSIEKILDRTKFSNSEYFLLNDQCSSLLRQGVLDQTISTFLNNNNGDNNTMLSQKEMIQLGQKVLMGAKLLLDDVENETRRKKPIDPLKMVYDECRSFSSRSRFSQRSRYSHKKRAMFRGSAHGDIIDDDDDESTASSDDGIDESGSLGSNELENNDVGGGDEMLLRLAVWNRTWKSEMVKTLDEASIHNEKKQADEQKNIPKKKKKGNGLEQQLQNLFFGEKVIELMSSKKKTATLPPDEITEVLYDLALSVSSTVPLNVDISGQLDTSLASVQVEDHEEILSPRVSSSKKNSEIIEATRFLLDDIMPLWLETFRPMQIQQRRVMWPLNKDGSSSIGTPDDLSTCSSTTGWSTNSPERKGKLEERIASMELDPDTRSETCYLVHFYFKRKILSLLDTPEKLDDEGFEKAELQAVEFIDKFGSYLNLYEALNAASEKFSRKVIQKLLELATHDLVHLDYMKLFSRTGNFVPYESRVLSCLLASLKSPIKEGKARVDMLAMLVAAYPDLKPWQLRSEKFGINSRCWEKLSVAHMKHVEDEDIFFYYDYLSQLMENSHMARSDISLVNEWCFLSVTDHLTSQVPKRRQNFINVASGDKDDKTLEFARDVIQLIEFSNDIKEYSLSLKLANEIICSSYHTSDVLTELMKSMQRVSLDCLGSTKSVENPLFDVELMTDILELLKSIATSSSQIVRDSIDVTTELGIILDQCKQQEEDAIPKEEKLVSLVASIVPSTVTLTTLSNRYVEHLSKKIIISALRVCLEKGSEEGSANEISSALINLRRIRPQKQPSKKEITNAPGIWEKVKSGTAVINK